MTRTTARAPGCRSARVRRPVPSMRVPASVRTVSSARRRPGPPRASAGVADHAADEQGGRHPPAGPRPACPPAPAGSADRPAEPAGGRAADRSRTSPSDRRTAARRPPRPRPARPAPARPITTRRRAVRGRRPGRPPWSPARYRRLGAGGPFGSSGAANMFTVGSSGSAARTPSRLAAPAERNLKPGRPSADLQPAGAAAGQNGGVGARVLVVEDAEAIRTAVLAGLAEAGYDAAGRPDGRALEHDLAGVPARPGGAGRDAARPGRVRAAGRGAPHSDAGVVMLTARDGVDDRLRGLHGGADDYVVKPFVLAELVARVTAVLRRLGRHPTTVRGRRPAGGRGGRRGAPRRGADRADRDRAAAAGLPGRAARPGGEQGPDPDQGVGLHRLRSEPGGGARLGAAPQARRAAPGAHGARARATCCGPTVRREVAAPTADASLDPGTAPLPTSRGARRPGRLRTVSLRRRVTALSLAVLAAVLLLVVVLTDVRVRRAEPGRRARPARGAGQPGRAAGQRRARPRGRWPAGPRRPGCRRCWSRPDGRRFGALDADGAQRLPPPRRPRRRPGAAPHPGRRLAAHPGRRRRGGLAGPAAAAPHPGAARAGRARRGRA